MFNPQHCKKRKGKKVGPSKEVLLEATESTSLLQERELKGPSQNKKKRRYRCLNLACKGVTGILSPLESELNPARQRAGNALKGKMICWAEGMETFLSHW